MVGNHAGAFGVKCRGTSRGVNICRVLRVSLATGIFAKAPGISPSRLHVLQFREISAELRKILWITRHKSPDAVVIR